MGSSRGPDGRGCLAWALLSAASAACSALYSLDGNVGPVTDADAAGDVGGLAPDASGEEDPGGAGEGGAADAGARREGAADAQADDADAGPPPDTAPTWCTTRLATDSFTTFCCDFDQPTFAGPLLGAPTVDTSEYYAGSAPASLLLAGTAGARQGVQSTVQLPSGGMATASFELHVQAMPSGPDPHILELDFGTDALFLFISAGNDPVLVEWNVATNMRVQQVSLHPGVFFVPGSVPWRNVTMTLTATACSATIQGYGSSTLTLQNAPASLTQVKLVAGIAYQTGTSERFNIDNVTLDVQP